MKSFNVDDKLTDPDVIKVAIFAVYKSLKKSKWKRKQERAEILLANMDTYVNETIIAVKKFEKMKKLQELELLVPDDISSKAWIPKKCSVFIVKDGPSGKERDIVSTRDMQDKIIHQLVVEAGKPVFMRGMYRYSCGSIPKRGTHDGVKYLKKTINHHTRHDKSAIKYGVVGDITKCYQSFSHTKLKEQIRKKFRGKLFYWLVEAIIDTYHCKIVKGEKYGIPIGFPTSQWLCNFSITEVDHKIKASGVQYFLRYVDDIAIFGRSKKFLHKVVMIIREALEKLGLRLKDTWQVFRYDYIDKKGKRRGRAFDILGYRFFRDKTILRKRNALVISRQARKVSKAPVVTARMARSTMSRIGSLRHCNSFNFYKKNVKPFVNIKKLKEVIRIESRKHSNACLAV